METDLNESEQIMADFVLHNATFGAYTGYALILFILLSLGSFDTNALTKFIIVIMIYLGYHSL